MLSLVGARCAGLISSQTPLIDNRTPRPVDVIDWGEAMRGRKDGFSAEIRPHHRTPTMDYHWGAVCGYSFVMTVATLTTTRLALILTTLCQG